MSKLAEIKEFLAATTPEPWVAVARHCDNDGTQDEMDGLGWDVEGPPEPMRGQFSRCADAQFMAHSKEFVRLLLAVVEAESAGLTPKQVASVYAYSLGLETDSAAKEALRQKRQAWEAIA